MGFHRDGGRGGPSRRLAMAGTTVSATTDDRTTAMASVKPNSRNSPPSCPGRNDRGTNTAASVADVVTTAKNTCCVPSTAAARGPMPSLRRRTMFSSTTMASSTTSPVASTSARSVRMLTENPASQIAATVPISATGSVTAGISVARMSVRNSQMIATTSTVAISSVDTTSSMAPRTKVASSDVTDSVTSGGRSGRMSCTAARTPSEIDSVFDCAARTMPRPRPVCPLARRIDSPGAGPRNTCATSPTTTPGAMGRSRNASGVLIVAVVRTDRLCPPPVSRPDGESKFTLPSADRRSASVSPRAASWVRSTSMRNTSSRAP